MQPVSGRWDAAVRGVSRLISRCEVWRDGSLQQTLAMAGGRVRLDETSAVRRALTCSLADLRVGGVELTPKTASDLLAPTGVELRVWSGYAYSDGSEELVPVGYFPVSRTARESWLGGLTITAPDRSRRVSRARFLTPWTVAAGTLVTSAIRSLLASVDSSWEVYDLTGSQSVCSAVTWDRGDDRWERARELAASIGAEIHLDASGRWLIRAVPQGGTPVWSLDVTGAASLLDVGQSMDSESAYNILVASSSELGAEPVSGMAYISSGPLSVARYGAVPYFFSTPVGIKTRDQAVSAALAMLPRVARLSRVVTPRVVPNRALDVGDPLTLTLPGESATTVLLSGAEYSLGPDSQGMALPLRDPAVVSTALTMTGVAM